MTLNDCRPVLALIAGYWPSPALTEEEALAWRQELTGPLQITPDEARAVLVAAAESGAEFRPRAGQVVAMVQAHRRHQASANLVPALATSRDQAAPLPTALAWIRACKAVAGGTSLDEATRAEGLMA